MNLINNLFSNGSSDEDNLFEPPFLQRFDQDTFQYIDQVQNIATQTSASDNPLIRPRTIQTYSKQNPIQNIADSVVLPSELQIRGSPLRPATYFRNRPIPPIYFNTNSPVGHNTDRLGNRIRDMNQNRVRHEVQPEVFYGDGKQSALSWLRRFDALAIHNEWTEDATKIKKIIGYLDKYALNWWITHDFSSGDMTWDDIKQSFIKTFDPISTNKWALQNQLLNRKLGINESIITYIQEKLQMCSLLESNMSEESKMGYILLGLPPYYVQMISMLEPKDSLELEEKLNKMEFGFRYGMSGQPFGASEVQINQIDMKKFQRDKTENATRSNDEMMKKLDKTIAKLEQIAEMVRSGNRPRQVSFQDQRNNRFERRNENSQYSRPRPMRNNACYNCGDPGHYSNQCTQVTRVKSIARSPPVNEPHPLQSAPNA